MVFKDLDDCATAATGSANETRYAFEVTQVNTSRPTGRVNLGVMFLA